MSGRLSMIEGYFVCTNGCGFWSFLSKESICKTCHLRLQPHKEVVGRAETRAHYKCDCGKQWQLSWPLRRTCVANCGASALPSTPPPNCPVAAECCGAACWELSGRIGSPVMCRRCDGYTPATRRLGDMQRVILASVMREVGPWSFALRLASIGPVHSPVTEVKAAATPISAVASNPFELLPISSE